MKIVVVFWGAFDTVDFFDGVQRCLNEILIDRYH